MSNNSEQKQRKYCGSGKEVTFKDKEGNQVVLINQSICITDSESDIYEYNKKKYLRITVGPKRDGADQYGKTHSVWINDYNPNNENNQQTTKRAPVSAGDGLPF